MRIFKKQTTDKLIQTMNANGNIFISHSNKKNGDGYKYESIDYTHWITFMDDNKIHMYSDHRFIPNDNDEHIYDTGVLVGLKPKELDFLIKIFTK